MLQVHCDDDRNVGKNIKMQYTQNNAVTKIDNYRNILEGNILQDIKHG